MRTSALAACLTVFGTTLQAGQRDPLTRARTLYNDRQFEEAVAAADEAAQNVEQAASADLIAARALLERYRETAADDDLVNARDRLRRIEAGRLTTREQLELLVGLAEALYFDGSPGAAADLFESVLDRIDLSPAARDRVLDWWATALERDAHPRSEFERQAICQRVRDRMRTELVNNPGSGAAAYWLAAAARGQGDLQGAWDAAQAGWLRAPLASDLGEALRADLDRLVLQAIVPERAKALGQPPEQIQGEWEKFKERWQR
jgi:hypothetical protein